MPAWRRSPRQTSTTGPSRLLLTDLLTATMLLTRLPVARFGRSGGRSDLARCAWAFPVVGLVVNATGGLVYGLAHRVGMSPLLAAGWSLAAMMISTGALHEDGLADTADGFGGGATLAWKLEIMRDSRIGSYGVLALLLSVIIRAAAIAALSRPGLVIPALVVAGMLGRGGILVLLLVLKPARVDGLGASMQETQAGSAAVGLGLAIAAALVALPAPLAVMVVILGLGACLAAARLAHTQIGGYTGDVLGAAEVVAECLVLAVIASAAGP